MNRLVEKTTFLSLLLSYPRSDRREGYVCVPWCVKTELPHTPSAIYWDILNIKEILKHGYMTVLNIYTDVDFFIEE